MTRRLRATLATVISDDPFPIQLALHYLETYFKKRSPLASRVDIGIMTFPAGARPRHIAQAIARDDPGLVGFSCYVWNIERILKTAVHLKKLNPRCTIVLGGPEVSPRAAEVLRQAPAVDAVARGEGERTFTELVELAAGRGSLSNIKGIAYRQAGREIRVNPDRPPLADLNAIPSPYLEGSILPARAPIVPLETMRGCPFRCGYCYYHKDFRGLRRFPLSRIERELKLILAQEPAEVYIMDPTFNIDGGRAKAILRLFCRYNRSSRLHCELRAELLDRETARLLRRASARFVEIGVQSINPKALGLVHRSLDRAAFKRGLALLNEAGVPCELQLIDGLPGDSYADLKRSVDWAHRLNPSRIRIMRLKVLPGTDLRRDAGRLGLRFDPRPPYHRRGTVAGLRRVEALRSALSLIHDKGVFKRGIDRAAKLLGMGFSDVLEAWMRRRSRRGSGRFTLGDVARIPGFLESLSARRGKAAKFGALLPVLREDLADALAAVHGRRRAFMTRRGIGIMTKGRAAPEAGRPGRLR